MIPARIGSYKFRVFADTGSTVNVIPLHFARFLKLQVNRRNAKSITLANGSTRTVGTVSFNLTINNLTKRVIAVVLKDFYYTMLLSLPTCGQFKIVINTANYTVSTSTRRPDCLFIRESAKHNTRSSEPKVSRNEAFRRTHTKFSQNWTSHSEISQNEFYNNGVSQNEVSHNDKVFATDLLHHHYEHIFTSHSTDFGRTDIEEHRALLADNIQSAQHSHRQSVSFVAEVTRQVKELFEECLIHESISPNAAPITLPENTDDTTKLATDYSRLNSEAIDDKTSHPLIFDDIEHKPESYIQHLDALYRAPVKLFIKEDISKHQKLDNRRHPCHISPVHASQHKVSQIGISQTGTSQSEVSTNANVLQEYKLKDPPGIQTQ